MQVKKDYTHNLIVTVARQVFLKKGYVKASMRDIAKGAGIGVSNLYNYFKGKDELFRYVVMPLINEMERMMRNHHSVKEQEQFLHYVIDDVGDCNELMAAQVHVMLGYDYFHATRGLFSVYRKNSETWFKLKYSF